MNIPKVIGFWASTVCQGILIWYSFKTCIYLGVATTKDVGELKFVSDAGAAAAGAKHEGL